MSRLQLPIAWNLAILAILPAGCMQSADSGDYEVILDGGTPEAGSTIVAASDVAPDSINGETAGALSTDAGSESQVNSGGSDVVPIGNGADSLKDGSASPIVGTSDGAGSTAQTPDKKGATADAAKPDKGTGTEEAPSEQPTDSTAENGDATPKSESAPEKPAGDEKPAPREVKLLIAEKDFRTEGPENALRVSFDDFDLLKVLNMEPVTEDAPKLMPKWLKELDGKRIRVRGFMYPPFEETGIRAFTLARDNQICCFGRNPLVYDLVDVFLRDGETSDYIQNRPFDVVGVFHIGDSIIPGQLYTMDDAVVLDK